MPMCVLGSVETLKRDPFTVRRRDVINMRVNPSGCLPVNLSTYLPAYLPTYLPIYTFQRT